MIPTGNKAPGIITLDKTEAMDKNAAPTNIALGRKNLWSSPTNILAICGATSPIKPITPTKLIAVAVIMDTKTRVLKRKKLRLIPILLALASPNLSAVKAQESRSKNKTQMRVAILTMDKFVQFDFSKEPKSQKRICCEISGAERYCTKDKKD